MIRLLMHYLRAGYGPRVAWRLAMATQRRMRDVL